MKYPKKVVVLALIVSVLTLSGVAYALNSTDFKTKGDTWVSNNCDAGATNKESALCYSVLKSEELQAQLDGVKQPWLKDSSNNKLGLATNSTGLTANTFYAPSINLWTSFEAATGYVTGNPSDPSTFVAVNYASNDCSGQGYVNVNPTSPDVVNKQLLSAGVGSYWKLQSFSPSTVTFNSKMHGGGTVGVSATCSSQSGTSSNAYPVQTVTIPFTDPISLPTLINYEQ